MLSVRLHLLDESREYDNEKKQGSGVARISKSLKIGCARSPEGRRARFFVFFNPNLMNIDYAEPGRAIKCKFSNPN